MSAGDLVVYEARTVQRLIAEAVTAERERIRQLAIQRKAVCRKGGDYFELELMPFADLIGGDA
jgi:hypothetical protein